MSDDLKLSLARAIHGTPHATRMSFSPEQWNGVERAWEWVEKNYHPKEPPMKQENENTPPWTAEQREAAEYVASIVGGEHHGMQEHSPMMHLLCAELVKVAPLFVSPPPVPSVEECERAYDAAWNSYRGDSYRSHAGIAAVRALFVKGDGASVPGDSGLKAGHNMERGSGCPTSDHHADRETSTTQAPKEPAPSPTPAPDREALRKAMLDAVARQVFPVGPFVDMTRNATRAACENAAIAHFAPIVDALTLERGEAREILERAYYDACGHLAWACSMAIDSRRASVPTGGMTRAVHELAQRAEECRSREETALKQRDAALARVAEMEKDRARNVIDLSNVDPAKLAVYEGSVIAAFLAQAGHGVGATDATLRAMGDELARLERERDEARSKPRSVTGEDLRKMEDAAVNNFGSWREDLEAALRAVGIEVVG